MILEPEQQAGQIYPGRKECLMEQTNSRQKSSSCCLESPGSEDQE